MKTMIFKPVVFEDDAAPDSYESFCKEFEKYFQISFKEFKRRAVITNFDGWNESRYENIMVSYAADHPYYTAYAITYVNNDCGKKLVKIRQYAIDLKNLANSELNQDIEKLYRTIAKDLINIIVKK